MTTEFDLERAKKFIDRYSIGPRKFSEFVKEKPLTKQEAVSMLNNFNKTYAEYEQMMSARRREK